MKKTERLDTILLRHGWVSEAQVFQALMEQERLGEPFGSTLVVLGYLTETQLAEALAEQYDTPKWDPQTAVVERSALDLFPERWVREKGFLPLAYDPRRQRLEVALSDPTDIILIDEIRIRAEIQTLVVATAPRIALKRLWDKFYGEKSGPTDEAADTMPLSSMQPEATPDRLGLEFSFAVTEPDQWEPESQPVARVLLWLSQPFVAKLLTSLLEVERCRVGTWDGVSTPDGDWDHLIYDNDNASSLPDALPALKRRRPRIQLIPRPSLTTSLLRSPLSYERLRDGYIHLAEYFRHRVAGDTRDPRLSRYALAVARVLSLASFETDTLLLACELAPLFVDRNLSESEWEAIALELRCPYPVVDLLRGGQRSFADSGAQPGESIPESSLAARIFHLISAFLARIGDSRLKTIDDLSSLTDWLHSEAGLEFDPVIVEALLRVLREEVLDGCLPPGPAEVILVSDHPVDWNHLTLQLQNEGWRVVIADGGAEARKLAERRQPDAVVWAAAGAIEWVRYQSRVFPGIVSFLLLEELNQPLARKALESGYDDVWTDPLDPGVAAAKLKRAVTRRSPNVSEPGTVNGSLDQLGFIDLVQILSAGSRSVAIELNGKGKRGRVVLWQGQIKFAEAAGIRGESAVYEIVTWETGTFSLRPTEEMPPVNCRIPNDAMLLEGCRLMDEKKERACNVC